MDRAQQPAAAGQVPQEPGCSPMPAAQAASHVLSSLPPQLATAIAIAIALAALLAPRLLRRARRPPAARGSPPSPAAAASSLPAPPGLLHLCLRTGFLSELPAMLAAARSPVLALDLLLKHTPALHVGLPFGWGPQLLLLRGADLVRPVLAGEYDLASGEGWWLAADGWWLVAGGWWLVAGGWWLVAGGWWLVAGGWRLVAGGWRLVAGGSFRWALRPGYILGWAVPTVAWLFGHDRLHRLNPLNPRPPAQPTGRPPPASCSFQSP
jgi:hypothetical protein